MGEGPVTLRRMEEPRMKDCWQAGQSQRPEPALLELGRTRQ